MKLRKVMLWAVGAGVVNVILMVAITFIWDIPWLFIWIPLLISIVVGMLTGEKLSEKSIRCIAILVTTFIIWGIILLIMLLYWEFTIIRPGRSCIYYNDCP